MSEELPEKIDVPKLAMSQTGFEIQNLSKEYNSLPVNHPKRKKIYEKIEDLSNYEQYWD